MTGAPRLTLKRGLEIGSSSLRAVVVSGAIAVATPIGSLYAFAILYSGGIEPAIVDTLRFVEEQVHGLPPGQFRICGIDRAQAQLELRPCDQGVVTFEELAHAIGKQIAKWSYITFSALLALRALAALIPNRKTRVKADADQGRSNV